MNAEKARELKAYDLLPSTCAEANKENISAERKTDGWAPAKNAKIHRLHNMIIIRSRFSLLRFNFFVRKSNIE